MGDATVTFQVDENLKQAFGLAVQAQGQTEADTLRELMREYVGRQQDAKAYDTWFREQVQIGLDDANAGRLLSSEEVEAHFAAKRAASKRKIQSAD